MIKFRQKEFVVPLVPLIASAGAGIGVSAVQGSAHHKQDMAQQEEFQRRQAVEAKKQNEALNKIAAAAEQDPAKAQQAAAVIQQKGFAAVPAGFLNRAGNVTYDFVKALNNAGQGGQIKKKLAQGLAMGATMTAAAGVVDKAIQIDRNKITGGAPLPVPEKSPEEKAKKRKKALIAAGAGTATAAAAILAARHGKLGAGWEKVAKKKLTGPNGWGSIMKDTGKQFLKSSKENLIPKRGSGWAGMIGPGITYGLPAATGISYVLGERKQLKEQSSPSQQKQYAEADTQPKKGKAKSVLKKVAIGTGVAATAIAAGRRGAFGAKTGRYLNDWYMSRGAQLSRLGTKTSKKGIENLGNKMMDSGSKYWGKFNTKAVNNDIARNAKKLDAARNNKRSIFDIFRSNESLTRKNNQRFVSRTRKGMELAQQQGITADARRADILSGNTHTSLTGSVLNSKPVRFITFQEGDSQKFLKEVAKNHKGTDTEKVANFLTTGTGKTLAAAGAVGVGLAGMAPFGWGDKAVRGAARAVDKNAFAYEKSKEQNL